MSNQTAPRAKNSSDRWVTYKVTGQEGVQKVQEILTGPMGVSRRMIQRLTRSKGIRLNGKTAFLSRNVKPGDILKIRISSQDQPVLKQEAIPLHILFEDEDILIVNKPAGLAVHPTEKGQSGTLANGIAHHLAARGSAEAVRPVHRLDLNTSGVIAFAKNQYAHHELDRQLRNREMQRTYLAVMEGVLAEDELTINEPIARQMGHPTKRTVDQEGDPAVTVLKVLERLPHATIAEVQLQTGRTHQIRVHLSHLGHPLVGDFLYGSRASGGLKRQALHALRLSLIHPTGKEPMIFQAPLPADLAGLIQRLREQTQA